MQVVLDAERAVRLEPIPGTAPVGLVTPKGSAFHGQP